MPNSRTTPPDRPRRKRIPSLRHHKPSGQGFVELNGYRKYLGRFGLPETEEKYRRTVGEWLSNGKTLPTTPDQITVNELISKFWDYAKLHYRRPDGSSTNEPENIRLALRPVKSMYGSSKATEFGPRALKAVRQDMIERGGSRGYINKHVSRIKRMFKWAVAEELISPQVSQALDAVPGLKHGRSEARETESVKPVCSQHVHAIRPFVSRQVWAMVLLQLHTGARSGEIVILRPRDVNRSCEPWEYTPREHKTAHLNHERTIFLGPEATKTLEPFFSDRDDDTFAFSPREAEIERRAKMRQARKTPLPRRTQTNVQRSRTAKRAAGERYTTDSYRRAIQRGCDLAGVPRWHPHQLRHSAATRIRKEMGLEAAQLILGHRRADVTQIYAEISTQKAREIAQAVG